MDAVSTGRVPFATVLHANQLVIGDGYADRDGISVTACGYDAVLTMHLELGIPVSLHLSGSLVEALAWHRPDLLRRVHAGLRSGLVRLVGGTYGENIVPLASSAHNRRQLVAMAQVMRDLLRVDPADVATAWLPERVWRTGPVVSALHDPTLPGGGYRRVLVDDRAVVPLRVDKISAREVFDGWGPYAWPAQGWPTSARGLADPNVLRAHRVSGTDFDVVPLCSHLRYLVPPFDARHLALVDDLAQDLLPFAGDSSPPLLVFGDDLERVAGVAGWEPALERYATFLQKLVSSPLLEPVHLDDWCDEHPATQEVDPDPATYYELAHLHGAGEDYTVWADDPRWAPYAQRLRRVDSAVQAAVDARAGSPLVQLADRLAMLGHHETAWQDRDPDGPGTAPAPWARATAAHAAEGLPLLLADGWFAANRRGLRALLQDVDDDGVEELVLAGRRMVAVLRPRWGARLTLLVRLDAEETPRVLVGNPVDHWNFQEELGRFMDRPAGHPGALGVMGSEQARFEVSRLEVADGVVVAVLDQVVPPDGDTEGGDCSGRLRLTVTLGEDADALGASWTRLGTPGELSVRNAICPDYHAVLLGGRERLRLDSRHRLVGAWLAGADAAASGVVAARGSQDARGGPDGGPGVWLGVRADGGAVLEPPVLGEAGHAVTVTVRTAGRHLDLVLGGGSVDDAVLDAHLTTLSTQTGRPAPLPRPVADLPERLVGAGTD